MTGKKRGRPPGSKNRPKPDPVGPLTTVSLEDAYVNRPREQFPADRYRLHADQRRVLVIVTDRQTGDRSAYPLARFLRAGEIVHGGFIDDKGRPHPVHGEGNR